VLALWFDLRIFSLPMLTTPANLEPVPRDEKKLRRTAWILVFFALVGGVVIFMAYERYASQANREGRPSYVGELRYNLPVLRQDGIRTGFDELQGKVWILHSISVSQPETCALSVQVMKDLAQKYQGQDDVVLISAVIDPGDADQAGAKLQAEAARLGAKLPQWWIVTTEPKVLHKYLKDKCKLGMLAHQDQGTWVYDTSLVLVDRNLKLRKAVIPQQRGGPPYVTGFDFAQASSWDTKGVKTGTERSNVGEMQRLLEDTIEILRNETLNP
jgi:cytochrome oxidase Cu insertion factor (SCO1/SenC/PrrC family)